MSVSLPAASSSLLTRGALSTAIASNAACSIGGRARWTSLTAYNRILALDGPVGYRIIDRAANSTNLNFTLRNDTTDTFYTLQQTGVVINTWYHCVLTWDATTLKAYVNGALIDSVAASQSDTNTFDNFIIGNFDGSLQDLFVYSVALDANEVMQLYSARLPKRRTNLVTHWPFFAGTNRTIDYTGHGNTLTPAGSPADGVDAPVGWGLPPGPAFKPFATGISLAGSSTAASSATGAMNLVIPQSGDATSAIAATATISIAEAVSGSSAATTSASATINVDKGGAGSAIASTAATATMIQTVSPTPEAFNITSATGSLSIARALSGSSAMTTSADGSISVQLGMSDTAVAVTSATAAMTLEMQLGAGSSAATTSATAAITVASAIGVGNADASTSATATIGVVIGLSGSAGNATAADGGILKEGYSSAPTVTTSATAAMTLVRGVAGSAVAATSATAFMKVDIALTGTSATGASADGGEVIYTGFASNLCVTGTSATAVMTKDVALVGEASNATYANAYGRSSPLPQRTVRMFADDAPTTITLKTGGE